MFAGSQPDEKTTHVFLPAINPIKFRVQCFITPVIIDKYRLIETPWRYGNIKRTRSGTGPQRRTYSPTRPGRTGAAPRRTHAPGAAGTAPPGRARPLCNSGSPRIRAQRTG